MYGPRRGAYADFRGSRRDCDSQPMLIRRELRSGALIAAERVELSPRVGSGSCRCGCAIPRGRPLRGTMREPVMQSSRTRRLCRTNGISLSATHCHRWNSDDEGRFPTRTHGEAPGNSKDLLLGRRVRIIGSGTAGEFVSGIWITRIRLLGTPQLAQILGKRPPAGIRQQYRKCGRAAIWHRYRMNLFRNVERKVPGGFR